MTTFIISILFPIAILATGFITWKLTKEYDNYRFGDMIKILQEIAVDYHVRVISNGYGSILCENEEWLKPNKSNEQTSGCVEFGTEHQEPWIRGFEHTNSGEFYIIHFRMLGKYYLAYSEDNLIAWINVVRKARKENKKFFSKANIYDRNKI